jgi:hypothetical protein
MECAARFLDALAVELQRLSLLRLRPDWTPLVKCEILVLCK